MILNVGCGKPRHYVPKGESVNLDIWRPYLKGKENPILADCRTLPFRAKSFCIVVAVEIMEHLNFSDGLQLVETCEEIAKEAVIFTTPQGFFSQPELDGNPYQKHLSHYKKDEFPNHSYINFRSWHVFYVVFSKSVEVNLADVLGDMQDIGEFVNYLIDLIGGI